MSNSPSEVGDRSHQEIIDRIHRENTEFYSAWQGRGMLNSIEHTFEERWIYLFEIVQNAVDAGAKRISILPVGDALVIQHDGIAPLTAATVTAMSHVFQSTKGATTVGFMGIGFKSVFRRFLEARISGFDWSFRYTIDVRTGEEFGDRQPNYLGAVVPVWDASIEDPDPPYTTRFEFSGLLNEAVPIEEDLERILPSDDPTVLALLGYAGLREIIIPRGTWKIEQDGDSDHRVITARITDQLLRWRLFVQEYVPSRLAVARFLERRRLQPASESDKDRVYSEATRPQHVVGIIPVSIDDAPELPLVGKIYATLPTSATWPFRMHLHADWLVNVSRSGLPSLNDNEWQHDIVNAAAGVIANYLNWLAGSSQSPEGLREGYRLLALPKIGGSTTLDQTLASPAWLERMSAILRHANVLPTYVEGELTFVSPVEAVGLPIALRRLADHAEWLPNVLFCGPVVTTDLLGGGAVDLLIGLQLWQQLDVHELNSRWSNGPSEWWSRLSEIDGDRRQTLFELWTAVASAAKTNAAWNDLACVPTADGAWRAAGNTAYMPEPGPSPTEPLGQVLLSYLQPFYPKPEQSPIPQLLDAVRVADARGGVPTQRRVAREWYEAIAAPVKLETVVHDAVANAVFQTPPPYNFFIAIAQWSRQRNRASFVTHVVAVNESLRVIAPVHDVTLAEPYVERGSVRRALFGGRAVVVSNYLDQDPHLATPQIWRAFFEGLGLLGPLRVRRDEKRVYDWETAEVAEFAAWSLDEIQRPTQGRFFTLRDRVVEPELRSIPPALIAPWLEDEYTALRGNGHRDVDWFRNSLNSRRARKRASWVDDLQRLAWVPTTSGQLLSPALVLPAFDPSRDEVAVARLSEQLITTLIAEGVTFGTAIPVASDTRRLQYNGDTMTADEFADSLRRALDACADSEEERTHLADVLSATTLPLPNETWRVPFKRVVNRLGPGFRSGFDGWIIALTELPDVLRSILLDVRLPVAIPDTTTGEQSLGYLRAVWTRAAQGEVALAKSVRPYLPSAYAYVVDDMQDDASLVQLWEREKSNALVFGMTLSRERRWASVQDVPTPIYDDLREPIILEALADSDDVTRLVVTPGHLGEDDTLRERVVRALGIPTVTEELRPEWIMGRGVSHPEWTRRFDIFTRLLRHAHDDPETDGRGLTFVPRELMTLQVRGRGSSVYARLHGGEFSVAGNPADFAAEATALLVDHFRPSRDLRLIARATMLISALDDAERFVREARRFAQDYAPDFDLAELPAMMGAQDPIEAHPPLKVNVDRTAAEDAVVSEGEEESLEAQRKHFDRETAGLTARLFPRAASEDDSARDASDDPTNEGAASGRPTTPTDNQVRRGEKGEREFVRRVSADGGWAGLTLMADRTHDGCGYDFLCLENGAERHIEVKTFTASGSVIITPKEWSEAGTFRASYCLIGFLDNGGDPSTWQTYRLDDPYPILLEKSEWMVTANLSAPASKIFQLREP